MEISQYHSIYRAWDISKYHPKLSVSKVRVRAGRARELTRSSRSKFIMVWHQFSTVQLPSLQLAWKVRSVQFVQFTNSSGPGQGHSRSRGQGKVKQKKCLGGVIYVFRSVFRAKARNDPRTLFERPKSGKIWKSGKCKNTRERREIWPTFSTFNTKSRSFSRYLLEILYTYTPYGSFAYIAFSF